MVYRVNTNCPMCGRRYSFQSDDPGECPLGDLHGDINTQHCVTCDDEFVPEDDERQCSDCDAQLATQLQLFDKDDSQDESKYYIYQVDCDPDPYEEQDFDVAG